MLPPPAAPAFAGPDFVIGGAPKCGTTSLCDALASHPDVFMTNPKEPTYYVSSVRGETVRGHNYSAAEYAALFDGRRAERVAGEGSTEYLWACEEAAPALRTARPDCRVVFMLRDPIERAYSAYWYRLLRGELPSGRTIGDHLRDDPSHWIFSGQRYADCLERWFEVFGHGQIHVLLTDDLRDNRDQALAAVCEHIGADPSFVFAPQPRSNVTRYPRWPTALRVAGRVAPGLSRMIARSPGRGVRSRLLFGGARPARQPADLDAMRDLFAPSVAHLSSLIDRDLSHWLR